MAAVSKEEYLKRYLSNSDPSVKKKRKKKVKTSARIGKSLIIDDDVNLSDIKATSHDDESQEKLLDTAEENPLIFDEAGTTVLSKDLETIKKKEEEKKAMWAPLRNVSDDEIERNSPNLQKSKTHGKDVSSEGEDNISGRSRRRHDSPSPERTTTNRKSADLSPPRRNRLPKKLERHSKADSSGDQSPPRRQQARHDSPDYSHPKITRNDFDLSPVRKSQQSSSEHRNLKRRHDLPDLSPEKKRRDVAWSTQKRQGDSRGTMKHGSPDLSPSRKTTQDTRNTVSPDQSPPRQNLGLGKGQSKVRNDTPDMSPARRMGNHRDSTSPDLSPPRKANNSDNKRQSRVRNDTPDISPPRRVGTRRDSPSPDLPPPRRNGNFGSKGQTRVRNDTPDMSPIRRMTGHRVATSPDLSPPRRSREEQPSKQRTRHDTPDQSLRKQGRPKDSVSPKRQRQKVTPDLSPKHKEPTKHERKAGLHSAAELKRENELSRRREDEVFSRMASSSTGKGAETVHRDKEGRKRDLKIEKAMKKEEERKKLEEDEKFMEWGKGLEQTKNAKNKVADDIYEMTKPLARYKDDEDLEQMLKEKDRSGDPMLAFIQKKKTKQKTLTGKKEKPKYSGPAPPQNRFNIYPGYRWDGVDRSNGFEKKRFMMLANKGATKEEAYKWSTEDM